MGAPAEIERIELDTAHFKGNYPDRCSIQAAMVAKETDEFLPMIFILVILINSSFLLCKEVKEIQMKIDALPPQTEVD